MAEQIIIIERNVPKMLYFVRVCVYDYIFQGKTSNRNYERKDKNYGPNGSKNKYSYHRMYTFEIARCNNDDDNNTIIAHTYMDIMVWHAIAWVRVDEFLSGF